MVDFRSEPTLGARIQGARKARGLKSTKDLADVIGDGRLTESVLENIESGRKANLDVSQLLNIAMALDIPVAYLLAPLARPADPLDLQNLSSAFDGMTSLEFDAWLGTVADGAYAARSVSGRSAAAELAALRAWDAQQREVRRLETMLELERFNNDEAEGTFVRSTQDRLDDSRREAERLAVFLRSAGWDI